jgi:ribonuclease HI
LADLNFEYLKIYFDGGSRNNPGHAAIGAVIYDKNNNNIDEISEYIGIQTNNIAEYTALDRVLDLIKKYKTKYNINRLILNTDSKLLYSQVKGIWKIKDQDIAEIHKKIIKKLRDYELVDLRLVPRLENTEADKLVNLALDNMDNSADDGGQFKLYENHTSKNGINFGKIEER